MFDNKAQSRKWLLTINNPLDHGMTHDEIIDRAQKFNPDYVCLADEIGASGTLHTHVYLYSSSPMRFGTVKKRFPTAHIDKATGTSKEIRDYVCKQGKWADTDKAQTSVEGTFKEFGTLPSASQEKSPKMAQLMQDVKDGYSTTEIIENDPSFAFKINDIEALREKLLFERFRKENRPVKTNYLFGDSGTGKTRSIYEKHPPEDVYRITDYSGQSGARFDDYHGEPVIVFEEFHSQVPISAMLNFLDIYPLRLPARYRDRVACFDTVYITSNIPLEQQYQEIQRKELETWRAFLRRIHSVTEFRRGMPPREVPHETV